MPKALDHKFIEVNKTFWSPEAINYFTAHIHYCIKSKISGWVTENSFFAIQVHGPTGNLLAEPRLRTAGVDVYRCT